MHGNRPYQTVLITILLLASAAPSLSAMVERSADGTAALAYLPDGAMHTAPLVQPLQSGADFPPPSLCIHLNSNVAMTFVQCTFPADTANLPEPLRPLALMMSEGWEGIETQWDGDGDGTGMAMREHRLEFALADGRFSEMRDADLTIQVLPFAESLLREERAAPHGLLGRWMGPGIPVALAAPGVAWLLALGGNLLSMGRR